MIHWNDKAELVSFLAAARGDEPVDLKLTNCRVVDLFNLTLDRADLAIHQGRIVGLGDYRARQTMDLNDGIVGPSFIDGHIHIESTMLTPSALAKVIVPQGTGAVAADPHEIANVLGLEGIRFMLEDSEGLPLDVFFTAPSCVPASPLESSGAKLEAADLLKAAEHPRVIGLAEMMNFPGVVNGQDDVLDKLLAFRGRPLDGHAPMLSGPALNAYAGAGPASDHECSQLDEAIDKLKRGIRIMIRQGSTARNLEALLPLINPGTSRRLMLVCDDRHPDDLLEHGHLLPSLRQTAAAGVDPLIAWQMVSLNPAEHFKLDNLGAVAPGRLANLTVVKDLESFQPSLVFHRGRLVARDGRLTEQKITAAKPPAPSMKVKPFTAADLAIKDRGKSIRVIDHVAGEVLTGEIVVEPTVRDGLVAADPDRDLAKLAVVDRHQASGRIGLGFIRCFGLRRGALASSVAHDSHNLIAVGIDDADLHLALNRAAKLGGGLVVVDQGRVSAELALPVAGLMSLLPADQTAAWLKQVHQAARKLGPEFNPFMVLSFLSLAVIPKLKLTDRGLVDVDKFDFVDLFVD